MAERILVSSVIRGGSRDANGMVFEIDWHQKKILHRRLIPSPDIQELGERGGARGARGLGWDGHSYYVANFNSILVFNSLWELERTISHPLFNGIHEIELDAEGIWVTSTGIDAVLKVDYNGNLLQFYALSESLAWECTTPRSVDFTTDHRPKLYRSDDISAHVNSIRVYQGEPLISMKNLGVVCTLDGSERFQLPPEAEIHNATLYDEDTVLVNASANHTLVGLSLKKGTQKFSFDLFKPTDTELDITATLITSSDILPGSQNSDTRISKAGWTRGLAVRSNGNILIGSSPAMILEVDPFSETIVDTLILDRDVRHAVHAIRIFDTEPAPASGGSATY